MLQDAMMRFQLIFCWTPLLQDYVCRNHDAQYWFDIVWFIWFLTLASGALYCRGVQTLVDLARRKRGWKNDDDKSDKKDFGSFLSCVLLSQLCQDGCRNKMRCFILGEKFLWSWCERSSAKMPGTWAFSWNVMQSKRGKCQKDAVFLRSKLVSCNSPEVSFACQLQGFC